ncbi:MMPL family transporter [Reyranella sp.]|uniref:MMPL family transporter n=1 Tax=Reyranella sp. TaxID=1929291 RepID=UPI00121B91C1|nr:MMPL family transporter [Reyranella sp.]TAJ82352.1 MAG: hopanoid biosynthesis-associated RND transporter HpnN [Reyranella sp.]
MLSSLVGRLVAASARYPLIVLLVTGGLSVAALLYAASHFAMTTDTAELISTKHEWRQRELAYEAAFPSLQRLTIVVIDGATPELAEDAATRLSKALAGNPKLFHSVRRPDGGSFFDRNGLLFLPVEEVRATTEGLLRSQFFLASTAADPSLRGVLASLTAILEGVRYGQAKLADVEPLMTELATTFDKVMAGEPAYFSWQTLMSRGQARPLQTRRVLVVQAVMDYRALQPGAAASDAIRTTARELGLGPANGVSVHLTGPVPLGDEEFASLAEDWHLVTAAMIAALLGILWLAVRSARVVFAILATTVLGLIITTGLGLLATGRFNLISVAFIPLFVGLGIDFSIQLSVRFLAERRFHPEIRAALAAAGRGVGLPLALAAAAIGVGFFAFLPTSYIGVAELGTIAGLGMAVAFVLSITLLPALLSLFRPRAGGMEEVGYAALAPVEAFLGHNRRVVLAVGLVLAVVATALLPLLRFDFNPLHLKSPTVESMVTLRDLTSDPSWTLNTINVLVPSLADAQPMVRRLGELPEVARTVTLQSFVPQQQEEKLAIIRETAGRLAPILGAKPVSPPSDAELVQSLAATSAALTQAVTAGEASESAIRAARRLADALGRLRQAAPEVRSRAAAVVVTPLGVMLDRVRALLQAGPVTVESLPADLVADWLTKDGRARIQAYPHANQETDEALWRFAQAVQKISPDATGVPISIRAAGDSVVTAFLQAGTYSAIAIIAILLISLRRVWDVSLTMAPVFLSGLLTFATCAVLDLPLNFANIIALPLLFGVGVAFNIYFVMAWRAGETAPLQSSLMRAVVFSALTTATAFGALWLSSHPGTASMGRLLMLSLGWELLVTLLFRPALLARPASPEGGKG